MQRVLTAWAPHTPCRDLPGILVAGLRRAGIQPLRQAAIPILNSSYNPTSFSYWVAQVIKPFVVSRSSRSRHCAFGQINVTGLRRFRPFAGVH